MSLRSYGWIPDLPDQRDLLYAAPPSVLTALPTMVDLRPKCPPVYDQGQLGSCTANAIGGAFEFEQMKQALAPFTPSRLFIYYTERVIEHSIDSDSGAQLRDGMKVVSKLGAPPETDWPYDIERFADRPPAVAFQDAARHQVLAYHRVSRILNQFKGCLAAGFAFVFGFTVYAGFESAAVAHSGHASMPQPGEPAVGGHAVVAVGYDDAHRQFIARNSWGSGWGMHGYFTIPYEYLMEPNLSDDFWTIQIVEAPAARPRKPRASARRRKR